MALCDAAIKSRMSSWRPSSFICASCARTLRTSSASQTTRVFSTTQIRGLAPSSQGLANDDEAPRWKHTPRRMTMPLRLRVRSRPRVWTVNTDQEVLDEAIDNFVGRIGGNTKGRDMLDEETKWLSLTHKSHAHGAQGFNDKLAFLGRRIIDWQTTLLLLASPPINSALHAALTSPTTAASEVYSHPALAGLENVTAFTKNQILSKTRLARLASTYRIDRALRWKPKNSDNLQGSGADVVLAQAIYSLIGALAMKQGGELAARAARERVLAPLGLRA